MNVLETKPDIEETHIREVIVNYRTTQEMRSSFTEPHQVAEFVRTVLTDNSREHVVVIYLDATSTVVCYASGQRPLHLSTLRLRQLHA
ncbi:hypothetical protein Pla100_08550 [Neorhodopirellula pilleata]|uniref:RadC-like JAB domain-containing protein n=1 Tax=Neorhodopirellula pilleata TaxID=2714738 RepID=A0A5C6AXM5_9BACT|nr:hypothetical protein Pla100_08550 [Neorhodopirellula pilleata]